ncbi:MAG: 5-formyltetrahydrofolate cyclo-ligase [Myxococcales bacterium]|nr:5-formyltetrahydrofolate cyclo-ligase [Polyangiaceae bacterium]MDW8251874.1 5-formyltetrahydrofolate cyclo-ligase [Myxococcales bacterium]
MDDLPLRLQAKRELRKRLRGIRSSLPASAVARRSEDIRRRIISSSLYQNAHSLALFWPIEGRNEVDLRPLVDQARSDGKRVALPATVHDGAEIALRFLDEGVSLDLGPLGFHEPPESAPLAPRIDLLVVPALAIDASGHRIGYGRGYYDRLLARMETPYESLAVAFDFQMLAEVPTTPDDVPVRWIATDRRFFRAGADPGSSYEASHPSLEREEPPAGIKVITRPGR